MKRNIRLEKVVASKQLRLAVETEEERRTRLEAFLKSWQLCLSFKLDVLTEGLVTPDLGVRDFEISKIQFRFQDFSQDFMISLLMFSFLLDFKDFN